MKYESKLIRQILTSPSAKRGLDYITPIYSEAYAALWLMQAAGLQTDLILKWVEEYKNQIFPQTASWSLPYFEEEYKILTNTALSIEQRRTNIILTMIARAPMNPVKLANILSLAVDAEISIKENTGKNTFSVEIMDTIGRERLKKIKNLTDKYKPAHLIYWLNSVISIEFYSKNTFLVKRLIISAFFLNLDLEIPYLNGKWNLDGTRQLRTLTKGPKLRELTMSNYVNNNENLGGRLIADNMWNLDGKYLLNSERRLNAEIKEFDL